MKAILDDEEFELLRRRVHRIVDKLLTPYAGYVCKSVMATGKSVYTLEDFLKFFPFYRKILLTLRVTFGNNKKK